MNKIKREERENLHTFSDTTKLILKSGLPAHFYALRINTLRK